MDKKIPRVIVLLAQGFEEIEALTPVDYLRRAGIEVCAASVNDTSVGKTVTGSHEIPVIADAVLEELAAENKLLPLMWDAVVIPGGLPGSSNLAASVRTGKFITEMAANGKWVCAICAAPALVLAPLKLLNGRCFTCYPGYEEKVISASDTAVRKEGKVVIDRNNDSGGIITSQGAGTAGEFSVAIIEVLLGETAAKQIADKVLL